MGKKRLRPWMEKLLHMNKYSGLKWIDQKKKIFCIPWKDKKNPTWVMADAEIFKEWALITNKYKEGDLKNPAAWKAQFRMALHKVHDFVELHAQHKLSSSLEHPYKVYRIIDSAPIKKSFNRQKKRSSSSLTSTVQQVPQKTPFHSNKNISQENDQSGTQLVMNHNIPTVIYEEEKYSNNVLEDSPFIMHNDISCSVSNVGQQAIFQQANLENNEKLPLDLESVKRQHLISLDSAVIENMSIGSTLPSLESPLSMDALNNSALKIKVYYLNECVLQKSVVNNGARLFYGNLSQHFSTHSQMGDETVYGPMNLNQIDLPDLDILDKTKTRIKANEKNKSNIGKILKHMERGLLILSEHDTSIYAKRQCKTRIFTWTQDGENKQLDRKPSPYCVFDLSVFKQQLKAYCTRNGPLPSPVVTFTFGEANPHKPCASLICATVTHVEADRLLKETMLNEPNKSGDFCSKSDIEDVLADMMKEKVSLEPEMSDLRQ